MSYENEIKIRYQHFLNFAPKVMDFLIHTHRDEDLSISYKGNIESDLVTKADKGSENLIVDEIRNVFPQDHILGEEGSSYEGTTSFKWIIDPLDGTVNYSHRVPLYCSCIGLEDIERRTPVMGIVPLPAMGQIYHAMEGGGAFRDKSRISVSKTKEIKHALLCTGFPYDREDRIDRLVFNLRNFLLKSRGVRRTGSAGLDICWVADGKFDAFWEEDLKPWDMTAAAAILLEAGGKLSTYDNNDFHPYVSNLVASNGKLHDRMIEILEEFLNKP
ncbi:inositol monophosphatase family protein [Leptospira fainei serovar Hurstbridge str. BUT 6]|uniref:Inositol-1-monophosphatase n=1 Tax=Leptospira fainei serovar Hurstbridge str. BUT 6 TaxID=1193011 RepID=S3UY19_9LEPT|nr:inositol monophosphatase family protein [Leptospira fainei]EPG74113.1 inositol monophosphatase family protein [Leptospira fainei serovar Hurstbridge str. BUT 6]